MKTVNVALLALIISATSSPVVLAGDTIEAAATELSAINSGMSQSEIEQKITRFLERTDNSPAAYTYLTEHHYIPSETPDTTQTPPVQTDPDAGQKTVAATGDVQTTARYQSMINARQSAVTDAQQTQITEQQAQIVATQKTLAATGDTQNTAHYQEMINARLAAQNEANQRTTTEQGQKMNALTTDVAAQQQKERAQYDKQMQSLAQKSVQAHEQIESLRQDSAQTQQQLTNTQKRVADNSQQINTL
ncbi:YadA family autotransporter adhesin, partial [Escherichia coli]|nr:YadA family autotransporter adhesin [Escherichia coli]